VLVQASQYYHFAAVILLAMGLVFQVPGRHPRGDTRRDRQPQQLRHNRRYAILACRRRVAAFSPRDGSRSC